MKKLIVIFLTMTCLGVFAMGEAQTITFSRKNASLEEAFQTIKEQTGYVVAYKHKLLAEAKPISVSVQGVPLEQFLESILQNQGLKYEIKKKTILIMADPKAVPVRQDTTVRQTQATPILVTGMVRDDRGSPVQGVSVKVRNTDRASTTDAEGRFLIRMLPGERILDFTCLGMQAQEVDIDGRTQLDIVLAYEATMLSDVVVTGYFNVDRTTYTGSATTITADDLARVSAGNVLQTLQVLDPSFRIVENLEIGSDPNALPDIEVRGAGNFPSLQDEFRINPNTPTFILDGFEVPLQKIFDLDPNRVASITILKDAAASAIYGSRAANGVVVVETNVPESGRLQINYKGDYRFSMPDLREYRLLNAEEKLEYELLSGVYPGTDRVSDIERNMDEYYQKLRLVRMGYDTDWLAQPLHQMALAHRHSLQVEEGTDKFRYNLNLFHEKDNGVMKESGRDRLGVGAYFQYRVRNLLFLNNLTYNHVKGTNSPYGTFSTYAQTNPYLPNLDINGDVVKFFDFVNTPNPLYNADIGVIDQEAYDEIINNFQLEWTVVRGLRLKTSIAFSKRIDNDQLFLPADHTLFYTLYNNLVGEEKDKAGTYRRDYGEQHNFNSNMVLSYFRQFNDHHLTFNGGSELFTTRGDVNIFSARGFPNSLLNHPSFATSYDMLPGAGGMTPGGMEDISRAIGFFGTLNYTWKNKYFTDLSARADANSKFGANNRWAKLWSAGVGWNIHYEDFLRNSSVISMLRLRASTGFTGSQNYNPNQSLMMFDYIRSAYYHRSNPGAYLTAMGNENLKWQRTRKHNIGLDFQLAGNRLTGTFDYYLEDAMDALTQVTLPPSLGFSSYTENLGQIRNEGYEVKLTTLLLNRPATGFSWSVFGSASHNKNTLLKISNALTAWNAEQDAINTSKPKVRFFEGQDMKAIWAVPSLGIDPATGQEVFLSKDGTYTNTWYANDQAVVGTGTPDLFGNVGTQLRFRQWQLNVYFLYNIGSQAYNQTLVDRVENANPLFNVDRRALEDRWRSTGDISRFKNIANSGVTKPTSRFVEDNHYIRLSSLNLSYELTRDQLSRLGLERLKFILYSNDVFHIASIKQERGLAYPFARTFTLTTQIGF